MAGSPGTHALVLLPGPVVLKKGNQLVIELLVLGVLGKKKFRPNTSNTNVIVILHR